MVYLEWFRESLASVCVAGSLVRRMIKNRFVPIRNFASPGVVESVNFGMLHLSAQARRLGSRSQDGLRGVLACAAVSDVRCGNGTITFRRLSFAREPCSHGVTLVRIYES